jgi:hypothetical protein
MHLFKRGNEYNKLAKAFNSSFIMLNELDYKINKTSQENYLEFKEEIFVISYIARRAVIERIKNYNWPQAGPIIIPFISNKSVTLEFAFNQLFETITEIANKMKLENEVNNILDKRSNYYEIEKIVPVHVINSI